MNNDKDFKRDLLAAQRIAGPVWERSEERKRLIVLARQLYHAGIIPHDIDALLSGVEREPQNPFEAMFMRGRKPTADDIDWESLERVVMKYFPSERPEVKAERSVMRGIVEKEMADLHERNKARLDKFKFGGQS